jgi:hypothetical protein
MEEAETIPRAVLWYAADLGGQARLQPVSAATRDAVLAGLAARLDLALPNLLGAVPQGFSVRWEPRALADLTPGAMAAAVPFLAAAMQCRARADDPGLAAEYPALGRLIAALAPTEKPASDLDRLFSMLDLGPGAGGAVAPALDGPAEAMLAEQITLLLDDPAVLRLEAAWRSLALFLDACPEEVEVRLISAPRAALVGAVTEALGALDPEDPLAPDAVLLAEVFDPRGPGATSLGELAAAAEMASVPLIAEAPADFLGLAPDAVASRHNPAAAMEGPAWNPWRGLRQKEASRWLGLAWNRPWLRPGHDFSAEPGLGLPGFCGGNLSGAATAVVGGLLAKAAQAGWPSGVTAPALRGPAMAEVNIPGGRGRYAVESPIGGEAAALLAAGGVLALTGAAGRDSITLPVAPSVKAPGRIGGETGLARERASLPYALATGRVTRAIGRMQGAVSASADPAGTCAEALRALLAETGAGAEVEVATLPDPEEPGGRMLEIRLRFGAAVLGGTRLAMDVPLG